MIFCNFQKKKYIFFQSKALIIKESIHTLFIYKKNLIKNIINIYYIGIQNVFLHVLNYIFDKIHKKHKNYHSVIKYL